MSFFTSADSLLCLINSSSLFVFAFDFNCIYVFSFIFRLRSFGVKPILDYSVEEDLSQEEAEEREVASSVSASVPAQGDALPQYSVDKSFADRRYKVQSARTYFYLNEATCEKNMEIFIRCLEAVANSTFGTGITAIKLTALGRPQLLVNLSKLDWFIILILLAFSCKFLKSFRRHVNTWWTSLAELETFWLITRRSRIWKFTLVAWEIAKTSRSSWKKLQPIRKGKRVYRLKAYLLFWLLLESFISFHGRESSTTNVNCLRLSVFRIQRPVKCVG